GHLWSTGTGTIELMIRDVGKICLTNVWYTPELNGHNLCSLNTLCSIGMTVTFSNPRAIVYTCELATFPIFITATLKNKSWHIDFEESSAMSTSTVSRVPVELLHRRMAHLNHEYTKKLPAL